MMQGIPARPQYLQHTADIASLEGVSKRFGKTQALSGVSLDVRPGELLALLGPNGAGKSTAISLLSGLRKPDSGTVKLFGQNPQEANTRILLGVTPQETGLPGGLRVIEVLQLVRTHYPNPLSIISKLGASNRVEAARVAREKGWL
jgi:ABC-2 type transport system ATP-binding protein